MNDTKHINITAGGASEFVPSGTKITLTAKDSKGFWRTLGNALLGHTPSIELTIISDTNPSKQTASPANSVGQQPNSNEQTNGRQNPNPYEDYKATNAAALPEHYNSFEIVDAVPYVGRGSGIVSAQCRVRLLEGKYKGTILSWYWGTGYPDTLRISEWLGLPTEADNIPKMVGMRFHCRVVQRYLSAGVIGSRGRAYNTVVLSAKAPPDSKGKTGLNQKPTKKGKRNAKSATKTRSRRTGKSPHFATPFGRKR